jgi:hypothetical protein
VGSGEALEQQRSISIVEADLARPEHARDVVALTQTYAMVDHWFPGSSNA